MSNSGESVEVPEIPEKSPDSDEKFFKLTRSNAIILAMGLVIILLISVNIGSGQQEAPVASIPALAMAEAAVPVVPQTVAAIAPATEAQAGIERHGEGRMFYSTIKIPANAEALYLSGTGASQNEDGSWGNMEEQAISTFNKFKASLETEGWSMSDIVQVRAFAVAGEFGLLDFDGFNRGYSQFFGTAENPDKPVRSFVQVADLVVDGWLVEVEIRAARIPPES